MNLKHAKPVYQQQSMLSLCFTNIKFCHTLTISSMHVSTIALCKRRSHLRILLYYTQSPWSILLKMIGVLGHDSALVRLVRLGTTWTNEKVCYETCPWCRINHSTCWPAVQRATTVPWMSPTYYWDLVLPRPTDLFCNLCPFKPWYRAKV